jgi:hypothetical protein
VGIGYDPRRHANYREEELRATELDGWTRMENIGFNVLLDFMGADSGNPIVQDETDLHGFGLYYLRS